MFDYRKDNLFIKAIIHELGHLIVGYIHGIVNLKSASNLNDNLNCSKELEHYAS